MEKIRETIRLREQAGLSERAISRVLYISRTAVKNYLGAIKTVGLDYAAVKIMDDDQLLDLIEPQGKDQSKRFKELCSKFEYFLKELKRPGVTLQCLWEEYRQENVDGYGYSQFCYHFQQWRKNCKLTMHIDHKAGDKVFVDFTGKHLHLVDKKTGEIHDVEVFVSILGASQLTYVEATLTQQKEDWIKANQNAFLYFGGVPRAIVPDCLKSAVIKGCKYEPSLNPEYMDFARHYQTTILPARPKAPRDKALVEGAVKIVYAWIFARLRNQIFHNLDDLNFAIREELEIYNSKPMQILKVSRKTLFNDIEKDHLTPLPKEYYYIRRFKKLKVQFNYHVFLNDDKHYFSVPYRYRGKQVTVIYTNTTVELFHKNQRIAFHKRDRTPNGYSTIKNHMPSHHRFVSDWNPQRFINWAEKYGNEVKQVIIYILKSKQHPEQAYKICMGILGLEKRYSKERLNKACKIAIDFHNYSYKGIKNILENGLEDNSVDQYQTLPVHKNIRGNQYYQKEEQK